MSDSADQFKGLTTQEIHLHDVDAASEDYEPDDHTQSVASETLELPFLAEQPYLIVLSGSQTGATIKVKDGLTIGRSVDATFQTVDEGVSRLHLKIVESGGQMYLVDLNSHNGTFVNGTKVTRVALTDGDKIVIGRTTIMKFSYSDSFDETFREQLYNAAIRDSLTGAFNRRHFNDRLNTEFCYAVRHRGALSLIMLDLDHFKRVNDQNGHPAGDRVLVGVGQILANNTRREDLFARYGGEEFVVLCRGIGTEGAAVVAERIRGHTEAATFVSSHPNLHVTISAGVASIPHMAISSGAQLVQAADDALYRAKARGRNCVQIFD